MAKVIAIKTLQKTHFLALYYFVEFPNSKRKFFSVRVEGDVFLMISAAIEEIYSLRIPPIGGLRGGGCDRGFS